MSKVLKFSLFILFTAFSSLVMQGQVRLSILLIDDASHQPVSTCNVLIKTPRDEQLIISDQQGKAECLFKQNDERITLQISHIAYVQYSQTLKIQSDTVLTIFLKPKVVNISDVNVYSGRIQRDGLNLHYFSPKEASLDVSLIGEKDIIRHIQTLPGIAQGMEGTLGMFVRGGNNGNNRIEIDGVPVYAGSHLFGLFSIFQAELVQSVAFKMGGIAAHQGNFLSSITSVETKNMLTSSQKSSMSISPFLIGASTIVPFKNNKFALMLGGRYSLLRAEYKAIKAITDTEGDINPQVMDVFIKAAWKIDSLNTVNIELLATNDYFKYTNHSEITQNWYNTIASIKWHHAMPNKAYLNTTAYYNRSFNTQKQRTFDNGELVNGLILQSGINEGAIKTVGYFKVHNLDCFAGVNLQYSMFEPGSEKIVISSEQEETYNENLSSFIFSPLLGAKYQLNPQLQISGGLKAYLYSSESYTVFKVDPRLLINYSFTDYCGVEVSYDHFTQLYHELEGLPTGWSLNVLVPSVSELPVEMCHQFYSGVYVIKGKYHINLGGYYKKMNNLASYITNENLFGVHDATWQDDIDSGVGDSYGLEFYAKRKAERWNLSLAYTLSKTDREFHKINKGESFPFKFDRRHILNTQLDVLVFCKENKTQKLFATFNYSSGHNTTIKVGNYLGVTPPYWNQRAGGEYIPAEMNNQAYNRQLMSSKNGYTLPVYIRLDIGYTFFKQKPKYLREFTISVFNVLNRKNPYLYYYEDGDWYQLSMFPIMPSLRWCITF